MNAKGVSAAVIQDTTGKKSVIVGVITDQEVASTMRQAAELL